MQETELLLASSSISPVTLGSPLQALLPWLQGEGVVKVYSAAAPGILKQCSGNEGKGCHFLPGSFSGASTMRHPCSPEWVLCILQHLLPTATFTGPLCFYGVAKTCVLEAGF